MPTKSERINVSIPAELFARLEAARGDVSRSKFVQRAIEQALPETRFTAENGEPIAVRPVKRKAATLAETWARAR